MQTSIKNKNRHRAESATELTTLAFDDGTCMTFHPKPDQYSTSEWFHMVKCYHTGLGHIVSKTEAAVEFIYDSDNPLYKKEIDRIWGVEATWHMRSSTQTRSISELPS